MVPRQRGSGTISLKPATIFILAGLFCIVLVSGCTTSPGSQPAAVQNVSMPAAGTGPKNMSAVIPQFDAYAEQTFKKSGVPGMAVAVVRNDTVVYLRCFGVKNITTREPVTPHTRFQLASISKSFTTATMAAMAGDGELSWDDRVASIYPDFRLSDPWVTEHITFRDLLSHRTGLPEYVGDELQDLEYNRSEIISRLRYVTLTGGFRSVYAYANIDVTSAAEAAAHRAGKPWEDLVEERIFVPAGMKNTSARFADFALAKDHADTYPVTNGTAIAGPLMNDDVNSPAGGVSSTISDMARYARLQVNEGSIDGSQVIAADALRETHTAQIIKNSGNSSIVAYGLGWEITAENGMVRVGHGGDLTSGVSTYIMLYPGEKMAIVVLTNGFPGGHILKRALTNGWDDLYFSGAVKKDWYSEIEESINEALQPGASVLGPNEELPPAPADAKPARPLSAYSGSYTQDYYGPIRIDTNSTGLLVYLGHRTNPMILVPYDGDTFLDTETKTGVNFTISSTGTAMNVRFTQFDMPGRNGTFVRISP
ncbi:MAG: serine hydrolase [Methanoregulaceae archaeon]|nr:serine hydrolase [Methanoregulaceae archaeon]